MFLHGQKPLNKKKVYKNLVQPMNKLNLFLNANYIKDNVLFQGKNLDFVHFICLFSCRTI